MNAIAATDNQLGALATLLPPPASTTAPATPVFLNLISVLFGPLVPSGKVTIKDPSEPLQSGQQSLTKYVASPKQIAEAMIRSMLGEGSALAVALPVVANPVVNNALSGEGAIAAAWSSVLDNRTSTLALESVLEIASSPTAADVPLTAALSDAVDPLAQASAVALAKADASTLRMFPSPPTVLKTLKGERKIAAPSTLDIPQALATTSTLLVPVTVESLPPVAVRMQEAPLVTSSRPLDALPLPSRTVDRDAARPLLSELAFSARLTPLGSSATDSESNRVTEPSPAASVPAAAQAVPLIETQVETQGNESKPQFEGLPAPVPVALRKESAGRTAAAEQPRAAASDVRTKIPAQPDFGTPIRIVAAAAPPGDFNRPFEAPVPPPATSVPAAQTKPETLFATADILRTSEPQSISAPQMQTSAVQEIAVRIARPEAPPVDLHVTQRAGEIQVSVHTPDTALQASLREDLSTLANSLERAGYHTETVVPRTEGSSQMNNRDDRQPQQDSSGRGGSGDAPGDSRDERRQQHNQNQRGQSPQLFSDEMEDQK